MNILNIVNFIRGVEPRYPDLDLFEPVKNQVELSKKYNLPTTFLIQYDAMLEQRYVDLLKSTKNIEIGAWLEVVQPLVEKIGIKWRGREGFSWDWHSDVGFCVGYTPCERKLIVDELMGKFNSTFGYYPKSVGSWLIDSETLNYLYEKYNICASCNCKDQWGTDGYSLWGGYYNQGYYPSKNNVLTPATTEANQINVPVFRMLGSDPVDQYDLGIGETQTVITLEPSYPQAGGSEEWVEWFLKENYNGECISFSYAQAGQENSFGWDLMKKGYTLQMKHFAESIKIGAINAMTLSQSGEWYKENYKQTPVSCIVARKDDKTSVWYCSKNYRSNFYVENDIPRIRDIFYFNENYKERYLNQVCTSHNMVYDNLPIMDGNRWSEKENLAGIYFKDGKNIVVTKKMVKTQEEGNTLVITFDNIKIVYEDMRISVFSEFNMVYSYNKEKIDTELHIDKNRISYNHNDFSYALKTNSTIKMIDGNIEFVPKDGKIIFELE